MVSDSENILFLETEKVGQYFDLETHSVIFDRYEFAGRLCQGLRALEVGCGSGIGLEYLSNLSKTFVALEYSHQNVRLLESKDVGSARVFQGDAHETNFGDGSFDLIIGLAMVYYLDLSKFLCEASRLLDTEGKLFFCTSNKDVPGFCEAPGTTHYYSIPELNSELTRAGFEAEFFGAFPKDSGGLKTRRFKAFIKNTMKSFFELTNLGSHLWENLRLKSLGKLYPLPSKITKANIQSRHRVRLVSDYPDFTHRVIYVVAKKRAI